LGSTPSHGEASGFKGRGMDADGEWMQQQWGQIIMRDRGGIFSNFSAMVVPMLTKHQ